MTMMSDDKFKFEAEVDPALYETDPEGFDSDAMTSGIRVEEDHRTHIDRLNGESVTGPAVIPVKLVPMWVSMTDPPPNAKAISISDLLAFITSGKNAVAALEAVLDVAKEIAPLVAAANPALGAEIEVFLNAANAVLALLQK